jgi:PAS domain S-box-containing protein
MDGQGGPEAKMPRSGTGTGLAAARVAAMIQDSHPAAGGERYRGILRALPDAIALTDLEGRILLASPVALAMFRASGESEVDRRSITDFLAPEERERAAGNIALMFRDQRPGPEEYLGVRLDGTRFPMEANADFLRDSLGRPSGLVFVVRDISSRKAAEEELWVSEARLRALLTAVPDLIFNTRRTGEILAAHASDPASLLVPPEVFLNRRVEEILPPPVADRLMAAIGAALDRKTVQEVDYSLTLAGEERFFEARLAPNAEDTVITVVRDVTSRVRAERQQRELQAQLLQAQKMDSLGNLAGGVAHDMNNVLAAILGLASASVAAQPSGSQARQVFETIIKAAQRGGSMVRSLLGFARQTTASERRLDLNELLEEQVRLLERTTLARIRVVLDLDPGLRPVLGDAGTLAHAFMNLCVNALDAMPGTGTLTLGSRNAEDGRVEVRVEDTGAGMDREVLERALEPFFTTKEIGRGTGLGLSMVYGAVKAHRGEVALASEPGRGTRVTLRFPACEPAPAEPGAAAEAGPVAEPGQLRVLVVDDDGLVQEATRVMLEVLGHSAVVEPSGEAALARLESGLRPDLVVLDLNMPGLGGAATLVRLRALRPDLPVLLATGRADNAAMDLVDADPRTLLLAKPFGLSGLRERIAEAVAG